MPPFVIFSRQMAARIKKVLAGLFLTACACALSGELHLISRDADGILFRHGAGWLNDHPLQAPAGNDGSTAFIAPMPEYDNSPAAQFQASYLATATGLTMLLQGVDPVSVLIGTPLRTTNTQIAGNQAMNVFAILCDERKNSDSSATSAILHIRTIPTSPAPISLLLGNSPGVLAVNCQVSMDASGGRILTYGQNIPTKLHILAGNIIASSSDLTAKIPYNGKRIVLSGDGNCIFFASDLAGYGLQDGQNGIFRYRLSDDSFTFVCAAGNINLDPELAVSADGKVVVFRRRTGALAVAELQDGLWLCPDDYPIRAVSCRHPAISADGRFVAYEASLAAGDIIQVYRHDRWRNCQELVSENASEKPASGDCLLPAISPDGRQVTFVSAADNLAGEETNSQYHVYRRELENPLISEDWMMLNLRRGWNPVAIPFQPSLESMARLQDFAGVILWAWDADNRRFSPLSGAATPGQGFWLYAESDGSISISGTAASGEVKITAPGWHLLGPAQVSDSPSLPLDSQSTAFAFNATAGTIVRMPGTNIEYGRACWTFVQ